MMEKLKSLLLNDECFYGSLIVLVGVCSFGLGRASSAEINTETARVQVTRAVTEVVESPAQATASAHTEPVTIVASKSGSKYHLLDCPGALQIKPENRIEFVTVEAAWAAGYTPAANCPGLK